MVAGVIWTGDDGGHEGWAAAEFPDGRVSTGGNAAGVSVQTLADAISGSSSAPAETVDGRTAIGWRGVCGCGWLGPLWRRVLTEGTADPGRRLVYWASPDRWDDSAPAAVKEAIRAEWRAHLPPAEITGIKSAAVAARNADDALDDAVRRARLAGETWAAIGDAAGMTSQGAHDRWGSRWQPPPP